MAKITAEVRAGLKQARSMFQEDLEKAEKTVFKHRKLSASGKETLTVGIPNTFLEAMKAKRELIGEPGNSGKQKFEMLLLESVSPRAAELTRKLGQQATPVVSTVTDAWIPKDDGEFSTHPIRRDVVETADGKSPQRYFWDDSQEAKGGVRCAPRPMGRGATVSKMDMDALAKRLELAEKAMAIEGGAEIARELLAEVSANIKLAKAKAPAAEETQAE